MSSLRSKSARDISDLLDEYGIKHGPVVDSTRGLYERKLKEAMAKGKTSNASPDKTYYREEEEVVYEYRTPFSKPVRNESAGDSGSYMRSRPDRSEREFEHEQSYSSYSSSMPNYRGRGLVDESDMYDSPSTYRNSSPTKTPEAPKSSRLVPLWVQFVFFLAVVLLLYLVFTSMETNESLKGIQ